MQEGPAFDSGHLDHISAIDTPINDPLLSTLPMNKNGVMAVVVVVVAIVLVGLWAMRSGEQGFGGADCAGPPSVPQNVNYKIAGEVVTITWAPAPATDSVATYLIEATTTRGVNPTTFVAPGSATSFQRQGPPAVYYVNVFARNACGTSGPSPELEIAVK